MEEQTLAEKNIHLLQPFKTATVLLSSESVVTLYKVIPVALKLRRCLEPQDADPGCVKIMKKEMLSNFDNRQTMDNAHQLASFLNAETKSLLFIDDKAHVNDLALSELRKLRSVEKEAPLVVKEEPVDPILPALPEASPPPKVKKWMTQIYSPLKVSLQRRRTRMMHGWMMLSTWEKSRQNHWPKTWKKWNAMEWRGN